jgi:hypothetical protein
LRHLALLLLVGCWSSPAPKAPTSDGLENGPPPDDEEVVAPPAPKELMLLVGSRLELAVQVEVGGVTENCRFPLDQAGFQIGDVPTLTHPIGHIKVDTLGFACQNEALGKKLLDGWLRDKESAPIQVFFEISSVGHLQTKLTPGSAPVTAKVLGRIQVDSHQEDVDVLARFTRPDADHLVIDTVAPVEVGLDAFARDSQLLATVARVGQPIAPRVRFFMHLELERATTGLPTFVRTGVMVQTMEQIRQKIDDQNDDYDVMRARMRNQGVSEEALKGISREMFMKAQEIQRRFKANGGTIVLPPPEELPDGAVPPEGAAGASATLPPGAKVEPPKPPAPKPPAPKPQEQGGSKTIIIQQ